MDLPIDIIPGTDPPRFEWRQIIDTPNSREVLPMEGMMPPSVEQPLVELIKLTKSLMRERAMLQGQVQGLCDRVAKQSDQLSKNAEKADATAQPPPVNEIKTPATKSPAIYPKKVK